MKRLQGKVAIITGAAHGIGCAIAEHFADEGAQVLLTDVDRTAGDSAASSIRDRGGNARFAAADVTSSTDIDAAVAQAASGIGRIDVLVNNAAHLADWLDVEHTTAEQWDESYSVTLKGAAFFTRAVLPWMVPH